jgi:hypothetical protein
VTATEARPAAAGPGIPRRLIRLYLASRRVPTALAVQVACALVLWIALHWSWDAYGALQLPLLFETACACVVAIATMSPFGEPEHVTGRWLPWLRTGTTGALTAAAAVALAAAGIGTDLAGGAPSAVRNLAGLTGIGLLCAAILGGTLAWIGPTVYMMIGVYALYSQWHGPAITTPWIWPARPPDDLGAAICAGLVFAAGMAAIALRGARDEARRGPD